MKVSSRKANISSSDVPSVVHDVLRSPGRPLDAATRTYMEPRFGHDFSKVRIHADTKAAESAKSVNALAYTVGRDVVFGAGVYSPSTHAGRQLVAHEMAHVVQQSTGQPAQLQRQVSPVACSPSRMLSVNVDSYRARGMLLVAATKLGTYSTTFGLWPSSVRTALNRHFGTTLPNFAGVLSLAALALAAQTQAMSLATAYICRSHGSYPCTGGTIAWAAWCLPGMPIILCDPNYFSQSGTERSTTLIHEWTHKFWCRLDIGYEHEAGYPQNLFTASVNADNFANLVRDVQ